MMVLEQYQDEKGFGVWGSEGVWGSGGWWDSGIQRGEGIQEKRVQVTGEGGGGVRAKCQNFYTTADTALTFFDILSFPPTWDHPSRREWLPPAHSSRQLLSQLDERQSSQLSHVWHRK